MLQVGGRDSMPRGSLPLQRRLLSARLRAAETEPGPSTQRHGLPALSAARQLLQQRGEIHCHC